MMEGQTGRDAARKRSGWAIVGIILLASGLLALVIALRPGSTPIRTNNAAVDMAGEDAIHASPSFANASARSPRSARLQHSHAQSHSAKEVAIAQPLPSIAIPVDERIALLRPLAEAGRADAMRDLGRALLDCRFVGHASDKEIRDRQIDGLLNAQQMNPDAFGDDVLKTMIDDTTRRYMALRDHCANVDPAEISSWLEWIDRAAEAGDLMAAFDYVTLAVGTESTFDGEKFTVSADEIARHKARGSELLWNLLKRGECDVLPTLVETYTSASESRLAVDRESDPAKAYAFMQALVLWRSEIPLPDGDADWQQGLLELAQKLDPPQVAAAAAQGRAIYERYCRGRAHNGE